MNKLYVKLFYLSILLFFFSCSPAKRIEKRKSADLKDIIEEKTDKSVLENYSLEKMRIEIKADRNFNFNGKLYISNNEFMFLTLQYLGFEVARVLITQDSIKYVNRIDRKYLFKSYKDFENLFFKNVNYNLIHNILVNGLFIPDGIKPNKIFYYMKLEEDKIIFEPAISKGKNLRVQYKQNLYIEKINYQDNINMIFLLTEIFSNKSNLLETIKSDLVIKNDKYSINVNTGKIENKVINMPEVVVNNKYTEIKIQ